MKQFFLILIIALCVSSCVTSPQVSSPADYDTGGIIRLNDIKWQQDFSPLPPGYKSLEAEASFRATREDAIQLAEFKAKLKVAELVSGVSISRSQEFINTYLENSGIVLVNQRESLDTMLSVIETSISRVEIPQTFAGEYQGKWFAKTRAIFPERWEQEEYARLSSQRNEIQRNWEATLAKARERIESLNRDALAAWKKANAPAEDAMQQGHDFYNQSRYPEAIAAYSNAVRLWESAKLQPPATVYEYIGYAHFRLGNYQNAIYAYRKAIEVDSDNANTRRALEEAEITWSNIVLQDGDALYNQGHYQDAITIYRGALAVIPGSAILQRALQEAEYANEYYKRRVLMSRFLNFEVYAGSSFATPLLIAGLKDQIYLFPYTFLDMGCDFGFVHGYQDRDDLKYFGLYPYGHINGWLGTEKLKFYTGVGTGYMFTFFQDDGGKYDFAQPVFDLEGGVQINFSAHSGVAASYSLRTPFNAFFGDFNHKVILGYLIRF